MPPTLIDYSQLSKTWKIAAGSFLTLLAVGGTVLTMRTLNSSGSVTMQEYSDGRRAQSGALTVGSGSQKNILHNDGRTTFNNVTYRFPYTDGSATGKVLKTNGAGQLSWSTDLNTGGGGGSVDTGAILAVGNSRWVNTSGDTMTGALSITGAGLNVSGLATTNRNISLQSGGLSRWTVRVDNAQNYKVVRHDGAGSALDSPFEINPTTGFVQIGDVAKAPSVQLEVNGAMSGSTLTTTALKNCTNVSTSAGGVYACNNNVYLATSTGALKTFFDLHYLRTSTGSLKSLFDTLYFRSSTGSLKTFFDQQYLRTSTGSLKVFFDANYFRTSTGALKANFQQQFLASSTGAVKANFQQQFLANSTGGLRTAFGLQFIQSSTGALKKNFQSQFVASSTGALKSLFDTLYFRSSTGSLKTYFDQQYLRTSTGSLKTLFDANYFRTSTGSLKAYFRTLDEARYVNTGGDTMTGTLTIRGTMTGWHLFAGTMSGAGLTDCDADNQTLAWDATSRTFGCGDDDTSASGFDFATADARYVKKQGDTMSGALVILMTGGNNNTVSFETPHTMSGRILHAQDLLTSSGNLVVRGDGRVQNDLFVWNNAEVWGNFQLNGNATVDGTTRLWNILNGTTLSGGLLTIMQAGTNYIRGNLGLGQTTADTKLDVLGTISGSALTISGLNAANCDLKSTNGVVSCGTDSVGSGFDQTSTDKRYVKKQGDTMTGKLLINLSSGTEGLEVIQVMSGGTLHLGGANHTMTPTDVVFNEQSFDSNFRVESDGNANMFVVDGGLNRVGINTNSPDNTFSVIGNADIADADTATKAYRFRTNGSALDLDASGADWYISIFDNADFTGTQRYKLIGEHGQEGLQIIGPISFRNTSNGTEHHMIDGSADGDVVFNEDSGDADIRMESNNRTHMLFIDSSADKIGVNNATPDTALDVVGTISGSSVVSLSAVSPANYTRQLYASGATVGTGTGKAMITIPRNMTGFILTDAIADVKTAGTTNTTKVDIKNVTKGRNFFSVPISIDSGELSSITAATSFTINASNDDVGGGDQVEINIPAVHTTAPKGLSVVLTFRKP